jgi:TonB family protein
MSRERSAGGRRAPGVPFPLAVLLFTAGLAFGIPPLFATQAENAQSKQEPAKPEPEEPVYDLGPGVTAPRVVRKVSPHYSGSRGLRVSGTVTIALVVTSQGLPKDPQVVKSLEKDVDQSALDAVRQWRFDPGKKDGKAVAVRIALELDFHSF